MATFTRAIVRPPGVNFSAGLTTVNLGTPAYELALKQHAEYCEALRLCGLRVMSLPTDERYPDSTFVEDTAILTKHCAIITRPGADTRRGEIISIEKELASSFNEIVQYISRAGWTVATSVKLVSTSSSASLLEQTRRVQNSSPKFSQSLIHF
jgi:dimethylargininase